MPEPFLMPRPAFSLAIRCRRLQPAQEPALSSRIGFHNEPLERCRWPIGSRALAGCLECKYPGKEKTGLSKTPILRARRAQLNLAPDPILAETADNHAELLSPTRHFSGALYCTTASFGAVCALGHLVPKFIRS
jgi:hypothetical protein